MADVTETLQRACRSGDVALLRKCIDAKPQVLNTLDSKLGWTPLYRAVICGHIEATRLLLSSGADPNIRNKVREVPLHQAADAGNVKLAQALLEHHAEADAVSSGTE